MVLDYFVVDYQPPRAGLAGGVQGRRYIGIRLAKGNLRMVDLGAAEEIDAICGRFIRAVSTQPLKAKEAVVATTKERDLAPAEGRALSSDVTEVTDLARRLYQRVVAPLEPLGTSILCSPDGTLAAVPFHALMKDGRFLVEDIDLAYCQSLLLKETLSRRFLGGSVRMSPPSRTALLLGDAAYPASGLPDLPGTRLELARVSEVLRAATHAAGEKQFEVRAHTEADATVSRLLEVERPLFLHIAAHGAFDENQGTLLAPRAVDSVGYYRQLEDMGTEPITQSDYALLRSVIRLSESVREDNPFAGGTLTALELASLNLLGCRLVVLSACETGVGVTEAGAGVLGFQVRLAGVLRKNWHPKPLESVG